MADIIKFPERKFTPPSKGWCASCYFEVVWPTSGNWPETCPNCKCAPFVVTSYLPEPPPFPWSPNLTS